MKLSILMFSMATLLSMGACGVGDDAGSQQSNLIGAPAPLPEPSRGGDSKEDLIRKRGDEGRVGDQASKANCKGLDEKACMATDGCHFVRILAPVSGQTEAGACTNGASTPEVGGTLTGEPATTTEPSPDPAGVPLPDPTRGLTKEELAKNAEATNGDPATQEKVDCFQLDEKECLATKGCFYIRSLAPAGISDGGQCTNGAQTSASVGGIASGSAR